MEKRREVLSPTAEAVVFLVFNGEKVLVETVFNKDSNFFGYERFPGGGIKNNENPEIAARRELKEELGISEASLTFLDTFDDTTLDNVFVRLHAFLVTDFDNLVARERDKSHFEFQTIKETEGSLKLVSAKYMLKIASDHLSR